VISTANTDPDVDVPSCNCLIGRWFKTVAFYLGNLLKRNSGAEVWNEHRDVAVCLGVFRGAAINC